GGDGLHAVCASDKGLPWLVAGDLRRQALPLVLADVGEIRKHKVEALALRHRPSLEPDSAIDSEPLRVLPSQAERIDRGVRACDLAVRKLVRDRERDGAR